MIPPLSIVMLAPFGIRPKGTLLVRMLPLAQALVQQGHQVQIIAPPILNPHDAGRSDVYGGVTVWHTSLAARQGVASTPHYVAVMLRPLLASRCSLVHLFKPKGYGGLALLLLRALRPHLPLVVDTDDWEGRGGWNDLLPYPAAAKRLFAWQEHDLPRRVDAVTVASRTLQTQVWGAGVPPERVFYLPNGVAAPPALPARQQTGATVLLYTRFWEFSLDRLVASWQQILRQYPAARLLVVGRGERGEEADLLRQMQQAGCAHSLDYRGWVQPAEIPALLAQATLAVVPLDDTLINRARCSVKLLELLAAGVPVVASSVGAVTDYITPGQHGLLVPPDDPAALAQAVRTLLADAGERQRLSEQASRAMRAFAWERLAPIAEHAYACALYATRSKPHAT